jgi:N,N'-diacetyllegionaminate synthase
MNVFIIAEAGINHNGSIETAYRLIDEAKEAGADAIKFQSFKANKLVTRRADKANYQKLTTNNSESQFDMIKKYELDVASHEKLLHYCNEKEIIFLSTPFDHDSIDLLYTLGIDIFKIPSGEITNLPYLRHIGSLAKEVILSSGMSTLQEVADALEILVNSGVKIENITVLHANTMYPTPMEDVNLNAMSTIHRELNVAVGLSDHTLGIEVDIAAVAMGAGIIEKHFTLDRSMSGPDHIASLEPSELKDMITSIRNIEKALGDGVKLPTSSEKPNIVVARKSIIAGCKIKKGDIFTEENIVTKRPGDGISPMKWDEIIGSIATKDYEVDDLI